MPISDIPILSMLRARMQWHQERQRVLAENVANADTPVTGRATWRRRISRTRCKRLRSRLTRTNPDHIAAGGGGSQFRRGTIRITRCARAATR